MKRDWLLVASIPIIFGAGIALFFIILPPETATLINFVVYASSLSTIVMVLVYIFTASQQLQVMRNQLNEMEYGRNVQVQPLLFFDNLEMSLDAPRFYLSPETQFQKVLFKCRIHFQFNITNIGNGPAVAVDFIPTLGSLSEDNKISKLLEHTYDQRIECLSLKKEDSQNISFMFHDDRHEFIESVMDRNMVVNLLIVFKNVLGMPFKEEIAFRVLTYKPPLVEKLKSCLKIVRTSEIDFAEDIREFEHLAKSGRDKEAKDKFDKMKDRLKVQLGGIAEIKIPTDILSGSFSITPISRSEYDKIISQKKEIIARA